MKNFWTVLVLALGGCGIDTTAVIAVGDSVGGVVRSVIGLLTSITIYGFCLLLIGGCSLYPKVFDSPEFQRAAVKAFEESAKSMSGAATVANPEIEFYYKQSIGGRVIGITGNIQGTGTTPGALTTQPAQ